MSMPHARSTTTSDVSSFNEYSGMMTTNFIAVIQENALENVVCEIPAILSRLECVMLLW